MSEKTTYTILSGESYTVEAKSEAEAFAKFFISYGHAQEEDYEGEGFDFSNLDEDVEYLEPLTEIM